MENKMNIKCFSLDVIHKNKLRKLKKWNILRKSIAKVTLFYKVINDGNVNKL